MSKRSTDWLRIAKKYADGVLADTAREEHCEKLQQAARRYLSNLERARDRSCPFKQSREAAARICDFALVLPYTEGQKAGTPFELEPWQVFWLVDLFGWVDRRTGLRWFTHSHVFMAKKNGKSWMDSVIGNYMAFMDGETNALVLTYAGSKEQASGVMEAAQKMVQMSGQAGTDLTSAEEGLGLVVGANHIEAPDGSVFRHCASKPDTQHGPKPNCVIIDELHVVSDDLWDTVKSSILSRDQPLFMTTSTAGFDITSRGHKVYQYAADILAGKITEDRTHVLIFESETDDVTDRRGWRQANPNLGVSIKPHLFEKDARDALAMTERGKFLTLNLNRWSGTSLGWIAQERWRACADEKLGLFVPGPDGKPVPNPDLKGKRAFVGCDSATKNDIFGVAAVFYEDDAQGRRSYWTCFESHISRASLNQLPNAETLRQWAEQGFLTVHEGDTIDIFSVAEEVRQIVDAYPGSEVLMDPAFGDQSTYQIFQKSGLAPVEVKTTPLNTTRPMKELDTAVTEKRFVHDGDPCVAWQVSNAVAHTTAKEFMELQRPSDAAKIDAAAALLAALTRIGTFDLKPGEPPVEYDHLEFW